MNSTATPDIRAEMKRLGLIYIRLLMSINPGREPWEQVNYIYYHSGRINVYRIEYVKQSWNDGLDADVKQALDDMLHNFCPLISGISHSRNADASLYRVTFTL